MKRTQRVLRAVAVVGASAAASLAAAMPAHAGVIATPPPEAVVTADVDPGGGGEVADFAPGPGAVGPEYVTDVPFEPNAIGPEV